MANIVIRSLDVRAIARLKERAVRNHRSLQAELREIIERAAMMNMEDSRVTAARIRRKLASRCHSDSAKLIAEDRRR